MELEKSILFLSRVEIHAYPSFLILFALTDCMRGLKFGRVTLGPCDMHSIQAAKVSLTQAAIIERKSYIQSMAAIFGLGLDVWAALSTVRVEARSNGVINSSIQAKYQSHIGGSLRRIMAESRRPFEVRAKVKFSLADRIMHRIVSPDLWILFEALGLNPLRDSLPLRKAVRLCLAMTEPGRTYSPRQIGYYTASVAQLISRYTRKLEVVRQTSGFEGKDPYHIVVVNRKWRHRIADRIADEQAHFMVRLAEGLATAIPGVRQELDWKNMEIIPRIRNKIISSLEKINGQSLVQSMIMGSERTYYQILWGGFGNVPIYFIKIKYLNIEREPKNRFSSAFWRKKRKGLEDLGRRIEKFLEENGDAMRENIRLWNHIRMESGQAAYDFKREKAPSALSLEPRCPILEANNH